MFALSLNLLLQPSRIIMDIFVNLGNCFVFIWPSFLAALVAAFVTKSHSWNSNFDFYNTSREHIEKNHHPLKSFADKNVHFQKTAIKTRKSGNRMIWPQSISDSSFEVVDVSFSCVWELQAAWFQPQSLSQRSTYFHLPPWLSKGEDK